MGIIVYENGKTILNEDDKSSLGYVQSQDILYFLLDGEKGGFVLLN